VQAIRRFRNDTVMNSLAYMPRICKSSILQVTTCSIRPITIGLIGLMLHVVTCNIELLQIQDCSLDKDWIQDQNYRQRISQH